MKILMTGMAARGIGSTKVKHHIVSLPDVIAQSLRELGHDVDGPRRVRMDEDLSGSEVVWMQLGWISSLSSTYAHEAAAVMAQARHRGIPVVRYVDDWRSQWLADDIAGHVLSEKGWDRHTNRFRAENWEGISPNTREAMRRELAAPVEGAPLLVPIMAWGDPSLFDASTKARLTRVVPWDPQRLVGYDATVWPRDEDRQRRWVVASLQDHDRWVASQHLGWPVERLGANPKLPGGVPIKGQKNLVIPEAEVCQTYAESWGVLSPEYDSAGSGYWRTRWFQAMEAGAILWPGAKDADAFGDPLRGLEPGDVEGMDTPALQALAAAFGEGVWQRSTPREQALLQLDQIARNGL